MSAELAFTEHLEPLTCGECGIVFAVPIGWLTARRENKENGGNFFCPNGHPRCFTESAADRLRKELEAQKRRTEMAVADAQAETARRKRAETKQKRAENKLRRVDNGICPECNRSFTNLHRHMKTKHAEEPKT